MLTPERSQSGLNGCPFSAHSCRHVAAAISVLLLGLLPALAQAQFTPAQVSQLQSLIGSRIEALTILGGDYGLAGGSFRSTGRLQVVGNTDSTSGVTTLGGAGDVGDPQPLGELGVGWQPRVQGNMGYIESARGVSSVNATPAYLFRKPLARRVMKFSALPHSITDVG